MPHEPFDPVVIDLADPHDYVVLVSALRQYADALHGDAQAEDDRIQINDLSATDSDAARFRDREHRALELINSIDRQIVANAAARDTTS